MRDLSLLPLLLIAAAAVLVDLRLLRGRAFNAMLAYSQLTFSLTIVGAAWLAESAEGRLVILLLGALTKLLLQFTFWRLEPPLRRVAEASAASRGSEVVFVAMSLLVAPVYLALMARGGLSWFRSAELRVSYTADNSFLLRVVRQWAPMLILWGFVLLRRVRAGGQRPSPGRGIVPLVVAHALAFAILEGSKSAALRLAILALGAAPLLGVRLRLRGIAVAIGASGLLLLYFLVLVARDSGSSVGLSLAGRLASGSAGLLEAVETPTEVASCEPGVIVAPLTSFAAKLGAQRAGPGFTSLGHCLAGGDPNYPWELLVPLLAEAYFASPWWLVVGLLGYVFFASAVTLGLARLCRLGGVAGASFPVAFFTLYCLLVVLGRGKLANLLISEMISILAFVFVAVAVRLVLPRHLPLVGRDAGGEPLGARSAGWAGEGGPG